MMSVLALALCTGLSTAEILDFLHPYVNVEDEIGNFLQVNTRFSAGLWKIECEKRIGYGVRCAHDHTSNISVSNNGQSTGHIVAIKCGLCAKDVSAPVLFGFGRSDGLGETLGNIIFHLATAWKHSLAFGGFFKHSVGFVNRSEPDFYKTLSIVLGFDYELLRPPVEPQKFGICMPGCSGAKDLQRLSETRTKSVFLDEVDADQTTVWDVLTPEFVLQWRAISGCSLAKSPNILHQYVNGEDETANILQVSARVSEIDLPSISIECEQRVGHAHDRCSAHLTNVSVSRHSQSGGHTTAIKCALCVKAKSGPVVVGVGRKDGLGQMLT